MTPEAILENQAQILSQAAREAYFENGFVIASGFLQENWLERIRGAYLAAVERSREAETSNHWFSLQADHSRETPRIQRIERIPDQDPVFWEFVSIAKFRNWPRISSGRT